MKNAQALRVINFINVDTGAGNTRGTNMKQFYIGKENSAPLPKRHYKHSKKGKVEHIALCMMYYNKPFCMYRNWTVNTNIFYPIHFYQLISSHHSVNSNTFYSIHYSVITWALRYMPTPFCFCHCFKWQWLQKFAYIRSTDGIRNSHKSSRVGQIGREPTALHR